MVKVTGLDHIVLVVADVERSLAWYHGTLGMQEVRVDLWRSGQAPFPSVRVDATTIIDIIPGLPAAAAAAAGPAFHDEPATPKNLDHLCFVVSRDDVDSIRRDDRFTVLNGPGVRYGAQGDGWSIYVSDPDGNTVELRSYEGAGG
jgi:catechol 2,3-dioxygenase-like lactoylglutathione lyase family enzyme